MENKTVECDQTKRFSLYNVIQCCSLLTYLLYFFFKALRNLKKSSFPSIEARKVVFHPTLSDLLCCETVDGDVLLLKLSDSSFSHLSSLAKDMENLQGKKTFSISWNVRN